MVARDGGAEGRPQGVALSWSLSTKYRSPLVPTVGSIGLDYRSCSSLRLRVSGVAHQVETIDSVGTGVLDCQKPKKKQTAPLFFRSPPQELPTR